ncbi:DUF5750 family protein [Methanobrevibacter oralis]|mgnify:FL=1|uniref:Uncharacterized protein n=1 Tax=Methanobrevibacter oralis TaxID=66851 RepID=A0A166ARS9_METOA|nr:DUF5750 family protein [Methanobrevibacter oralis]KZX12392.1 hypothetical protein MBORA_11460 [Methanobrevibacter oralis]
MLVKIIDYGDFEDKNFIVYRIMGLSSNHINYLCNNLDEKIEVKGDVLEITMYFTKELYPFQSEVAQFRLDDFIAREEIEMNVFLSSFLEDSF